MSRASTLSGFTTAIGSPTNLNVGILTATSVDTTGNYSFNDLDITGTLTAQNSVKVGPTSGIGITLNASGSATFAGFADFTRNASDGFGYLGIGPGGTNEKAAFVNRSGEIDLELYSNYSSNPTVSINSDGSASFAGGVTSNGPFDYGASSKASSLLSTGAVFVQKLTGDNSSSFAAYQGANTTPVAQIQGSGSAAFAGSVTIGTYDSTSNSTTGSQLNSIGKVVAQRTSGQGTSDVFAGYQGNIKNFSVTAEGYASFGGTNTQIFANGEVQLAANKINIQPDGSALFASSGSVAAVTGKVSTNNGGYNCFRGVNSSNAEVFYVSHNGRVGATGGIIFGSDTAAENVLDDYEEGTWTVAMSNGITLYGTQDLASYVKIGSSVTVFGQVRVNSGNTNANMLINNLPFACASQTENETLAVGSMRLYNAAITGAAVQVVCVTADGTTILYFNEVRDNNSDLPCQATNDGYYMFNITYRTSS